MAYGMGAKVELQKKPSFWVKHFNFLFKSDIDSFEGTECDKIRERIKKFNPNMFCLRKLFKNPRAKPDGTKMFCSAFLNDARMCCFFANAIVKY